MNFIKDVKLSLVFEPNSPHATFTAAAKRHMVISNQKGAYLLSRIYFLCEYLRNLTKCTIPMFQE